MNRDKIEVTAALGGLLATLATGAACIGPLVAILLGIGGFGWLTQYAYLRVPATVATFAVIGLGLFWAYRRPERAACEEKQRGKRRFARALLWSSLALALAVNAFEYFVMPRAFAQEQAAAGPREVVRLDVTGMVTPNCPVLIETAVGKMRGVVRVDASLETKSAEIEYLPGETSPDQILAVVRDQVGFEARIR